MWPFKSAKPPEDATARLERLEKTVKMLEVEWTEVYDKFRQLHMRVAKRVQRLEQAPETETAQRAEGDETIQPSGLEGASSLSARQRELNARILARRQRGGNGGLLHG
jgi:hypothetical protein